MGRRGGPSKERQIELAKEMGLTHLLAKPLPPEEPQQVHRHRGVRIFPQLMREAEYVPIDKPKEPCPCETAGLSEGRHKLPTGWCIDGEFWPFNALAELRKVEAYRELSPERMVVFKDMLKDLEKKLNLDLASLKITFPL